MWNGVPAVIVESDTLGTFKRLLDRHMEHQNDREWDSLILVSNKARHNIEGRRACTVLYCSMFLCLSETFFNNRFKTRSKRHQP